LPESHLFVILADILNPINFSLLLPGNKYNGIVIDIKFHLFYHWNNFLQEIYPQIILTG